MSFSNESGSCDSSHCSSGSSDEEASQSRNTIARIMYKLKPLNFSANYCSDVDEIGIDIMSFDPSRLTIKRNEINPCNWDALYDNKLLVLKLKSFSGILKRSQEFSREKYVKIKDRCLNKLIWEICCTICNIINLRELREKGEDKRYGCWFADYARVFMNYLDGRPRMRKTHYFEDVCIANIR